MAEVYKINGKPVSQEEFRKLQESLEGHRFEVAEAFRDRELTQAEVDRFLDFNDDGQIHLADFQRKDESSGVDTVRFGSVEALLNRHGFKVGSKFRLFQESLVDVREGRLDYVSKTLWHSREFVLQAVQLNPAALRYADQRFRSDPEIMSLLAPDTSDTYRIIDREVSAEEFEDFKKELVSIGIDISPLTNVTSVTAPLITRLLDLDRNGYVHTSDLSLLLGKNSDEVFEKLTQIFERHQIPIEPFFSEYRGWLAKVIYGDFDAIPVLWWENRNFVLTAVKLNGKALKKATLFQKDPEVVLAAVKRDFEAIEFAGEEFKNNPEIFLSILRLPSKYFLGKDQCLKHTGNHLREDANFWLDALEIDSYAMEYLPELFKNDLEFLKEAVRRNWRVLGILRNQIFEKILIAREKGAEIQTEDPTSLYSRLTSDHQVMLDAVLQDGLALWHASKELKGKRLLVLAAVMKNGLALEYASPELQDDKEIVMVAVKNDGKALRFASARLKGMRDVVLTAVRQDPNAIVHALQWRSDPEIALEILSSLEIEGDLGRSPITAQEMSFMIDNNLWQDRDFVLKAVRVNGLALIYAADRFKKDREIVLAAVKQNGLALPLGADRSFLKDKRLALEAARSNPLVFNHDSFCEIWSDDREVVKTAVSNGGIIILKASDRLKKDPELALLAISNMYEAGGHIDRDLWLDESFCLKALETNFNSYRWMRRRTEMWGGDKHAGMVKRVWGRFIEKLGSEGIRFPAGMTRDYDTFVRRLREYGITEFPIRFRSIKTLHTVIQNRARLTDKKDTRPIALLVYSRTDYNTAFDNYPVIDEFVSDGRFRVLYFEAGDDFTLNRIIRQVHEQTGRRVHTLVVAGHGLETSLQLGDLEKDDRSDGEKFLDTDDVEVGDLDYLSDTIDPEGQIFLYSCLNGHGTTTLDNLSNAIQGKVKVKRVLSFQLATNIRKMEIGPDLELKVKIRHGHTYDPVSFGGASQE